ncbi:CYFA0S11e03752g1_1 [Cyberlindnera fabianii]|uniref:CYFA0S11e03752g1_1 n=2 Tax=Cyberlindnera fabianii TaxID=36022 RepID=A0A061B8T6_CYBFA|nr:CYFA0S11e03752g1_1 [Cyberlindnera fabianii]
MVVKSFSPLNSSQLDLSPPINRPQTPEPATPPTELARHSFTPTTGCSTLGLASRHLRKVNMMDFKAPGLSELGRPPMVYAQTMSSRNSSQESLTIHTTRPLSPLPPLSLKTHNSNDLVRTRCKELIADYKELQSQLTKFTHRSSQLSKTNTLRLSLLRFLRQNSDLILEEGTYDKEMHTFVLRTATHGIKVLQKWWSTLLEGLTSTKLSNIDRSAYLECVSRIMARREWEFVRRSSNEFSELLVLTLEYCFTKLVTMKNIPLSLNAFIGKVFAYAFFEVEHFAPLVLFTLFVKNYTITQLSSNLPEKLPPTHLLLVNASQKLHPSLWKYIDYLGDFEHLLNKEEFPPQLLGATCLYPPRVTTFGSLEINLKDNSWVKKWAGFGSDVFCSFFKHYFKLCTRYFSIRSEKDIFHTPGFAIVYAHILEISNSSIQHIKKFRTQQYKESSANMETMITASFAANKGIRQDLHNFIAKLPIMSIFRVMRSTIYEESELLGSCLVKCIEGILLSKSRNVHAYDFNTCEAIYDVFTEFLFHLQHDSQKFSRQLDWHFWITGLVRMIQTGHMVSQVKALCFLFNIWNLLPIDFVVENVSHNDVWIVNPDLTVVYNLSTYMISKEIWESLFGHWNPLVRHYYNRLVVFKIIGTSNDNYGSYLTFKKTVKTRLTDTYELFKKSTGEAELTLIEKLDIAPSNPIVNKKLIITPVDPLTTSPSSSTSYINILDTFSLSVPFQSMYGSRSSNSSASTLLLPSNRKIYAYDIFDEAIYSSSFGSTTSKPPARSMASSRSSTVSPSLSSASLKRSTSGYSLGRVPILGTALSFFKRGNGSEPNLQSKTQTPLPTSPIPENNYEDLKYLRPSPYLNPNPSSFSSASSRPPSFIKKSPSMLSSPTSSISEISDEDPDSSYITMPKARLSSKSPGGSVASSSRVSSTSSNTSIVSMTSMENLPTPPELLTKIPDIKRFKYKFHLAFSNDSTQIQSTITKSKNTKFFRDLPHVDAPKRPSLPFEKSSLGLMSSGPRYCESESDDGNDDYEDSDEYDEYLMIPRPPRQSLNEARDSIQYDGVKNYMLLGKFLNEWKGIVDEYEKFMKYTNEFVSSDENAFVDPMLVADIPPIK